MNEVLLVSIFALVTAQLLKYPVYYFKYGKPKLSIIFSTGLMPSSHTSLVTAMTLETGMVSGYDSSVFAVAFVLAMITIHDAVQVRGESGKQAVLINKITDDLRTLSTVINVKVGQEERHIKLKELIGHTTNEVILGFITGLLVFGIYNLF